MTAPRQSTSVATAVPHGIRAELVHVAMVSTTSAARRDDLPVRARETAIRVQAALTANGYTTGSLRMPAVADVTATTVGTDLAFAISALIGDGVIHPTDVAGVAFYGELGLDGSIRATRGALAAVEAAAAAGLRAIVIPAASQGEAADLVSGIAIYVAAQLGDVHHRPEGALLAVHVEKAPGDQAGCDAPAPGKVQPDFALGGNVRNVTGWIPDGAAIETRAFEPTKAVIDGVKASPLYQKAIDKAAAEAEAKKRKLENAGRRAKKKAPRNMDAIIEQVERGQKN